MAFWSQALSMDGDLYVSVEFAHDYHRGGEVWLQRWSGHSL